MFNNFVQPVTVTSSLISDPVAWILIDLLGRYLFTLFSKEGEVLISNGVALFGLIGKLIEIALALFAKYETRISEY